MLAKDDVKKGKLDIESMKSVFAKWPALVVVYDDLALYLEALKKHNNFFKPDRKKHTHVWQTFWKLRDMGYIRTSSCECRSGQQEPGKSVGMFCQHSGY